MAELKPCPFCGGKCNISHGEIRVVDCNRFPYVPYCENEDCFMNMNNVGFFIKEQAIEAWNRRVEDGK